MSLFGFGKKKEEVVPVKNVTSSRYKVLGTGCSKCDALTRVVEEALNELGLDDGVEHVSELAKIAAYGVMSVPAFVVDEKVVSVGKVLSREEVKRFVQG